MHRGGFTLVEIVIAVVIFAALAMVAVPQFDSAVDDTTLAVTAQNQQMIQRQIVLYKVEHDGKSPHLNEKGVADTLYFIPRLTWKTDPSGKINQSGGSCGPYCGGLASQYACGHKGRQ